MTASALYRGIVVHRRTRPRRHHLRYRIFQMLIDLDEVAALGDRLRLFAHNRFGVTAFHDRDYGDRSGRPLRTQAQEMLARAGVVAPLGAIRLLTMPRVLGHGFNPLTIWFCHAQDGLLVALIHEVTNTFDERHSYVIAVADPHAPIIRQRCDKRFYVSPFLDLDLVYDFAIRPPGEGVATAVTASDGEGALMVARFEGERRALTDRTILAACLAHPLLTVKVVAAIHVEALRLWLKRIDVRRHVKPVETKG
ncbi:DUF1365 domain-containing protein [Sphingomonas sanxanigenens]|uniref:DUF1365 domain-containing protein n=1 Tax=Sphingomonas sanxanigenens DSM 19645 = NX02 TaxID=1123269 RepID=W0A313_9SPHN|nr:DUF1365 family protein [Sphingomonas sanxanigenens]AHE52339.1 hypothetical protein NX02_02910 [Sphingomonas sanxanigenens DSM 19645 = NX02]